MAVQKAKRTGRKSNKQKAIEALTPLGDNDPYMVESPTHRITSEVGVTESTLRLAVCLNDVTLKALSLAEQVKTLQMDQNQLSANLNTFATHVNNVIGPVIKRIEAIELKLQEEQERRDRQKEVELKELAAKEQAEREKAEHAAKAEQARLIVTQPPQVQQPRPHPNPEMRLSNELPPLQPPAPQGTLHGNQTTGQAASPFPGSRRL